MGTYRICKNMLNQYKVQERVSIFGIIKFWTNLTDNVYTSKEHAVLAIAEIKEVQRRRILQKKWKCVELEE